MNEHRPKLRDYVNRKETQTFEMKGAKSVEDPRILPRAVCAFLNADGGEVVVGLSDDGKTIEDLGDLVRAERIVRDRLASTLSPIHASKFDIVAFEDAPMLLIRVQNDKKGTLYAMRSSEGRFSVPKRIGDRTQPLDWPEVVQALAELTTNRRSSPSAVTDQRKATVEAMKAWIEYAESRSEGLRSMGGLFLVFRFEPVVQQDVRENLHAEIVRALQDPASLGVRREGWHYSTLHGNPMLEPPIQRRDTHSAWWEAGDPSRGYRWLQVSSDPCCALRFATAFNMGMLWGRTLEAANASTTLHPHALIETVSSCAQLFARLISALEIQTQSISAGLQLTRLRGRSLPPYRPGTGGFEFSQHWKPKWSDEDPPSIVRSIDGPLFLEKPQRLAKDVLTDVYRDFGYEQDAMPFWEASLERFVYR